MFWCSRLVGMKASLVTTIKARLRFEELAVLLAALANEGAEKVEEDISVPLQLSKFQFLLYTRLSRNFLKYHLSVLITWMGL